ncbi:EndoU domain-containing protein, partial [Kitasatospora sp. NPDC002551]|uniref:EndoU domain-containing protein n=1 Tax=Kitasatospora sp. NPDC002551 TaxID=3154539 RepID=UPI003332A674
AGVRIEGEVHGDRFPAFRPADDQPDTDPPLNAPHRPSPDDPARAFGTFGRRAEDVVRYGDRQNLTGLHHEFAPDRPEATEILRAHGVRIVETGPPAHNGTYRARAAFLDPTVAPDSPLSGFPTRWRIRQDDGGLRTMYPRSWFPEQLLAVVDAAHDNTPPERRVLLEDGRTYYWVGEANGVRIEGLSREGAHLAHRPTTAQPLPRWDPDRVEAVAPQLRVTAGALPFGVTRVRFDSGQEGLQITLPVRTHVQDGVTPERQAYVLGRLQRAVDEYVEARAQERADAHGVPRLPVSVVIDPDPAHPAVFAEVVVQHDAVSTAESVLAPLTVHGDLDVFHRNIAELHQAAPPPAPRPAPDVPADLREPGLRPDEEAPAVSPGHDQAAVEHLADLDQYFHDDALDADPRDLPAERSLPHQWSALDARWAAVEILTRYEAEHGQVENLIVRGPVGDVWVDVEVTDGLITAVHGVGDQRDHAQLHVPPMPEVPNQVAPALRPSRPTATAWQPVDLDGSVTGEPRRPQPPGPGRSRVTLPNGTVRVFETHLAPGLGEHAPLARFPSRWHRSALDPGTVHYPENWGATELSAHVTQALDHPLLTRHESDGSRLVVGRAGGVWIEGRFGPDGALYYHRPSPYQGFDNPEYHNPSTLTATRGTDVRLNGLGPVTVRRDLLFDGRDALRVTARVRLVGGEDTGPAGRQHAEETLRRAAEEYLDGHRAAHDAPIDLRLEFTEDADATEVRLVPGQDPTIEQAIPLLHGAAGTDRLAEVLTSEGQPQVPEAPRTVAGESMLDGRRRFFTAAAWDNPTEGRGLPREWTADEARYAATSVAGSAHRVPGGPAPQDGGTAPVLSHGSFAGVRLTVRVENGRITDFWAQPDQRVPDQRADRGPEAVELIGIREVSPPTDLFQYSVQARNRQRFTVERVRYADGDTESRITVRIHLDVDPTRLNLADPVTARGFDEMVDRARAAMAEYYGGDQRLPSGDRLRVRLDFVQDPADAHQVVRIHREQGRSTARDWTLDIRPDTVAHEVGHLLGLADEYREGSAAHAARPAYAQGLMGADLSDRFRRPLIDVDNPTAAAFREERLLRQRHLEQIGLAVDLAFGPDRGPAGDGVHPPRPRLSARALHTALYGTLTGDSMRPPGAGRDGGGHLFPTPGTGRPQPFRVPGSEHRNGTFLVRDRSSDDGRTGQGDRTGDLALPPSERTRVMFPEHWTSEDVSYAAQQAYQSALRRGDEAFTELGPVSWAWTGEYAGVRIEGEVRVRTERRPGGPVEVAEIVSFRPSEDRGVQGAPAFLPWHETRVAFDQQVTDLVRYGSRYDMTGVHHQPPGPPPREPGGRPRGPMAGERKGIKIGEPFAQHPNGTYRAAVWFLDPTVSPWAPMASFPSRWRLRADHPTNTFYPRNWTTGRVHDAVEDAYLHRNRADDRNVNGAVHWTGTGGDGIRIEGITRDGRHLVHRPADEQPGVVLPPHAQRSVPLTEPLPLGSSARRPDDRPPFHGSAPPDAVPADRISPDLDATAGRGLPREWTPAERLYAAYYGAQIENQMLRPDGTFQDRVRFSGVEITVWRDEQYRIVDFSIADGHVPPPQLSVPVYEPGRYRVDPTTLTYQPLYDYEPLHPGQDLPSTPGAGDGSVPSTPRSDDGSVPSSPEHDDGAPPRTPGADDGSAASSPGYRPATPEGFDEESTGSSPGYRPDTPEGFDEVWPFPPGQWPRTPGHDRGSEHGAGSPSGRPLTDEEMDLYRDADDDMESVASSYSDSTRYFMSDDDMASVHESDALSDTRSQTPDPAAPPRPAYAAAAPDLTVARVLDTAEVRAPDNPALHSSTATGLRAFQASRVVLTDGRPAVEVVVRIHLDTAGLPAGDNGSELRSLRDRARQGVDDYYNTGHRLPDGDVLVVRAEFVDDPATAHHRVEVVDGDIRENSARWSLDTRRTVLAHEIGHLLGLPDEYRERRARETTTDEDGNERVLVTGIPPRAVDGSGVLMGSTHAARDRVRIDQDAGIHADDTVVHFSLPPHNLRELGEAIVRGLGARPTVSAVHDLPARASFGLDARRSSLEGDTRTPGGHLLVPAGSDR